jgi:hypothetical protein
VAISFHLHGELDVLMDTVHVVEEVGHLAWPMWPAHKCVIHITELAEGLVGRHLQSHFFNVLHEKVSSDWGKWWTHHHTVSLLVELAIEAERGSVLSMLLHRTRAVCDQESLHDELEFLSDTSRWNGDWQVQQASQSAEELSSPRRSPPQSPFIPLSAQLFNYICQMLSRHIIKTVDITLRKIPSFLQLVKDDVISLTIPYHFHYHVSLLSIFVPPVLFILS